MWEARTEDVGSGVVGWGVERLRETGTGAGNAWKEKLREAASQACKEPGVIPAQAGIQHPPCKRLGHRRNAASSMLDSRLRGNDDGGWDGGH